MFAQQGEIWDIQFAEGHCRPGVVVSRNELNQGRLILVVPCTGSQVETRAQHQNNVYIGVDEGGLSNPSIAQVHLI